ncbi:MAG: hypothetical protein IPN36_11050 [Bacteroidetes bacterium]|nr:hypothetical protein [Bacteroidota bacterium]
MSNYKNEEMNPEDYWPEAGKMLDRHFAEKRRRRMIVFFSFFLAGTLGALYLWNTNREAATVAEMAEVSVQSPAPSITNGEEVEKNTDNRKLEVTKEESSEVNSEPATSTHSVATKETSLQLQRAGNPATAPVQEHVPSTVAVLPAPISKNTEATGKEIPVTSTIPAGTAMVEETTTPASTENIAFLPSLELALLRPDSTADYYLPERKELLQRKSRWDLLLYAGGGMVQKELSGAGSTVYLDRREKEEKPAYLPYAGLQLSKSIRNWDLRGGLEFAVVGEQVKYSPYTNGEYYNSYNEWEPYSYTISDTDSVYIFGNLFLNTRLETVNDSLYVTKTDTLTGRHYDPALTSANGINRWYIVEVPLEIVYNFKRGRWGAGISAGVAPGVVVQSSGRYLRDDETGVTKFQNENTGKLSLNARAGLEFSYLMNKNTRLMLRPSGRYFLTKMDAGNNTKQRYSSVGINAGILYMIP